MGLLVSLTIPSQPAEVRGRDGWILSGYLRPKEQPGDGRDARPSSRRRRRFGKSGFRRQLAAGEALEVDAVDGGLQLSPLQPDLPKLDQHQDVQDADQDGRDHFDQNLWKKHLV